MSQLSDIIKKVRRIEIKSKGLTQNVFSGSYNTKFKGRGISFSEIREYIPGDDVRLIDWKVSAKMQKTYVKIFHEEREQTVMLMIDVSATMKFGSHHEAKKDYVAEISGLLAMSAISNNDKVGLLLYADKLIKYIPPQRGKSHVLRLLKEILSVDYTSLGPSNLDKVVDFLMKIHKKKTICFLMTDFQSPITSIKYNLLAQKHDFIAMHVYDSLERNIPDVGWIRVKNLHNNEVQMIDTSNAQYRAMNTQLFDQRVNQVKEWTLKNKSAWLSMNTAEDYVMILKNFFLNRK